MNNNLILFNKPFGVISQFRAIEGKTTLASFIDEPGFYPAGRLDEQSEGLLLLTNDGALQARIADPKFKLPKTYWVQVEGQITKEAERWLQNGVELKDGKTRPAKIRAMKKAPLPPRDPPIRHRENVPDSWIEMVISEGKNRQVRRMTAAVGFPTLRLYRAAIGPWSTKGLSVGSSNSLKVNLPR